MSREVNRAAVAAHALVNHLSGLGDRTVLDGHGLAAVCVRHKADGESQHTLRSAVVGGTAGAGGAGRGSSVVESHLAFAGGILGAGAGGTGSKVLQRSGDGGCAEGAEDGEGLEDGGHCDCCVCGFSLYWYKKEVIDTDRSQKKELSRFVYTNCTAVVKSESEWKERTTGAVKRKD